MLGSTISRESQNREKKQIVFLTERLAVESAAAAAATRAAVIVGTAEALLLSWLVTRPPCRSSKRPQL